MCGVTFFFKPDLSTAALQTFCMELTLIGRNRSRPGNNTSGGRIVFPVLAEFRQQSRREWDSTFLRSLAAGDGELHPLTVDVGNSQSGRFAEPQSGCIAGQQKRAMLDVVDA